MRCVRGRRPSPPVLSRSTSWPCCETPDNGPETGPRTQITAQRNSSTDRRPALWLVQPYEATATRRDSPTVCHLGFNIGLCVDRSFFGWRANNLGQSLFIRLPSSISYYVPLVWRKLYRVGLTRLLTYSQSNFVITRQISIIKIFTTAIVLTKSGVFNVILARSCGSVSFA